MKTDIEYLKKKVEAGADYIMTQMFFENEKFFEFSQLCKDAGIHVPVIPGIKVLKSAEQLKSIPKNFFINVPEILSDEILSNPSHAREIGMRWASKQVEGLLAKNVPCVHFYVMNDTQNVVEVVKKFK